MSKWTKISIGVTIILIGIPTAAGFYPPLFVGLAEQLPLDLILTWMRRAGLTALGITIGWFVRGKHDLDSGRHESTPSAIGSIEGCIEVGGALWRGTAHLSGDQVKEVKVPYKPLCPNCQTIIYDYEKESKPSTLATTYWDCPSCGYQTEESINKYHDAEKIFDTKFKQIVESEGKEYSHENLTGSDPEEIWKNYAELVDDNQTSTNCFH